MAVSSVQRLRPSVSSLDTLDADVDLVLGLFVDDRPLSGLAGWLDWRLGGELSRCIQTKLCTGKLGEQLLLSCRGRVGAQRLFVFGLGERKKIKRNLAAFVESVQFSSKKAACKRLAVIISAGSPELKDVHLALEKKLDCQELFIFSEHATLNRLDSLRGLES